MRKAFIAAALLAALSAPTAALELSPNVDRGNPALQTPGGRVSLCRAHLEKQGYPYSYLRRVGSRGILSACARELWRKHHRTA
jgi:hypothetical protein